MNKLRILALLLALSLLFTVGFTACKPQDDDGGESKTEDGGTDGDGDDNTDGDEQTDGDGGDAEDVDNPEEKPPIYGLDDGPYPEMIPLVDEDFTNFDFSDWTVLSGEWEAGENSIKKVSGNDVVIVNKNWPNQLNNFVYMAEVRSIGPGAPSLAALVDLTDWKNEHLVLTPDTLNSRRFLYAYPSWDISVLTNDEVYQDSTDWFLCVLEYREGYIRAWVLPKGSEWTPELTPDFIEDRYAYNAPELGFFGFGGWQGASEYTNAKLYALGKDENIEVAQLDAASWYKPQAINLETAERTLVAEEDFSTDPYGGDTPRWEIVTGEWLWNKLDQTFVMVEGWDYFVLWNAAPSDLECFVYQADLKAHSTIEGGGAAQMIFRFDEVSKWHACVDIIPGDMRVKCFTFGVEDTSESIGSAPSDGIYTQDMWVTCRVLVNGTYFRMWVVPQGEEINENEEPILKGEMKHLFNGKFGLDGCHMVEFDNIFLWELTGDAIEE